MPQQAALSFLEHMFPAWRIHTRRGRMLAAVRVTAPTLAQIEAGLLHYVVRPTLDALAAVLTEQLEIAQQIRS